VFCSNGQGGLVVKGFVPNSAAANSGQILEGDLLIRVDGVFPSPAGGAVQDFACSRAVDMLAR